MATSPYRRLAIIAGGGRFPFEVADLNLARGVEIFVIALRGFADKGLARYGATTIDMLDPRGMIACLKAFAPDAVVLAGGVVRPSPSVALSVFAAFRNRAEIARVFANGDDGLLGNAIKLIEEAGLNVVGVDEVAPELLIGAGLFGAVPCPARFTPSITTGVALLAAMGPFDVGQALVIAGQRVLAVEGPEGTAAMLARVKHLRKAGRISSDSEPALLIKMAKAGQDRRADLPAVGPKTIEQAKDAGVVGLALGVGEVIAIDGAAMRKAADAAGIFIMGVAR